MGNAKINYLATFATASALAISTSSIASPQVIGAAHDQANVRYELHATNSSHESVKILIPEYSPSDIETRMSQFYGKLVAEQVDLEPEFAHALLENLDFLYED
ncbi:MAG TPA: hypothetical protein VGE28_12050 [Pseudomonas sp.]